MKASTIKCALVAIVAFGVAAAMAQEFGAGKVEENVFVQSPDGAMAQDQQQQERLERKEAPAPKEKPSEVIGRIMREDDIKPYDAKTGRIVVQSTVTFDVRNPKVSKDFIHERVSRMMELLMNAKAEVIKAICTRMSAERVLILPANPIRKQLAKEEEEIRNQVAQVKSLLDEAGVKVEEAKLDTKRLTIPELMAAVADVFKSDYAAKLDAEKKAQYKAAQKEFKNLKDEYDQLVEAAKRLQAKMSDTQKTSNADISLVAEMQIHGCTILEQAEGAYFDIASESWKYQISALYSWSEESQKAAQATLAAEELKFQGGKHSVVEWLDHYAKVDPDKGGLADWMGPRTYIDKDGNMWYLGIYATPVLSNAIEDEKGVRAAALQARAEVGFALYADMKTEEAYHSLNLDVLVDGKTITKKFEDYSNKTRERFSDLVFHGLSQVGPTYDLTHSSGVPIHVVVYGINACDAKSMKTIQKNAKDLAIEVNTKMEMERGWVKRSREQVEASRNNPAVRDAGAAQADAELSETLRKRAGTGNAGKAQTAPVPAVKQPAMLKQGTRFTRATDDF